MHGRIRGSNWTGVVVVCVLKGMSGRPPGLQPGWPEMKRPDFAGDEEAIVVLFLNETDPNYCQIP